MELRRILKASFVAYCTLLCVIVAKADVSCTAGIFVAGSQGVVRCDFGIDVTKVQHDFNVARYDFNISLRSRESLLACNWKQGKMERSFIAPGYLFDDRVDSTLTLVIPVVDKSMAGVYRCQLPNEPKNSIVMHFCNLTVIDTSSHESTDTLTVNSNSSTDTSSLESTDTLTVNSNSSTASATPLIASIVLNIVFVIVIIVICLCFRRRIKWKVRRLQRRFRARNVHQTGENIPDDALRDTDIPLIDITRHVKYPENTRHKPTQVYTEVIDKSIQVGNELGVRFDNKYTQLNYNDHHERTFLTGNLMAYKGDVVLTGSAERYRNPIYSTLGTPPVQLPTKYEKTDLGKKNSKLYAHVDVETTQK